MGGELEESKALLEAAVRGQRQVELELSDTREQMSDMQGTESSARIADLYNTLKDTTVLP